MCMENENIDVTKDMDQDTEENTDAQKVNVESKVDYLDKYQRCLAEFDNFRKRTAKEKASMYDSGVGDTIEKILPILDNFERALQTSEDKSNNFYKGIEMILKQLENILEDLGVEEIPTIGEVFDPNLHHAVAHIDDKDFGESEIVEQLQKGYRHKDKVIRFSMVKVAN